MQIAVYIAAALELFFFPSWGSAVGCIMTWSCLQFFMPLFTRRNIVLFPFSFAMFLSMFLYRFLPLFATLIEGKPITYQMESPIRTFLLETFLFLIGCIAFHSATKKVPNNSIQKTLARAGFYKVTPNVLWVIGIIGLFARLANFSTETETGDVGGKFIAGIVYLMNAPLLLLFPSLILDKKQKNNKMVIIYFVLITIINIASNSREAIIEPFFLMLLLFILSLIKSNKNIFEEVSPLKLGTAILSAVIIFLIFTNISVAMLSTRSIRADVDKAELFNKTIEVLLDYDKLSQAKAEVESQNKVINNGHYSYGGWNESYLDNFILNRYANIKITDITLYYADILGYGNKKMQDFFLDKALAYLPQPVLNTFGIQVDKNDLEYSNGDKLYVLATGSPEFLGGYRVTSHIADGLAIFGLLYFIVQFILWYGVFYLLNCFSIYNSKGVFYSPLALMQLFIFVGMFRNANGCISDLGFILRGFWQLVITYFLIFKVSNFLIKLIRIK